jgi:hypothetical protein
MALIIKQKINRGLSPIVSALGIAALNPGYVLGDEFATQVPEHPERRGTIERLIAEE